MATLALATLRIIDDRQVGTEAPVAKSRAFQLTVEEARVAPNVVTCMYLLLISLFILIFCLCLCVLL